MGVSDARIMFRHILPNTLPVLLPAVAIGFNNAVLSEASMSFLGIGVSLSQPSLGTMLNDSQTYFQSAPWYALSAGGAITLLILGFSLLSEGLLQRQRRD
jgi:peptide/nickel transport system permease protein